MNALVGPGVLLMPGNSIGKAPGASQEQTYCQTYPQPKGHVKNQFNRIAKIRDGGKETIAKTNSNASNEKFPEILSDMLPGPDEHFCGNYFELEPA